MKIWDQIRLKLPKPIRKHVRKLCKLFGVKLKHHHKKHKHHHHKKQQIHLDNSKHGFNKWKKALRRHLVAILDGAAAAWISTQLPQHITLPLVNNDAAQHVLNFLSSQDAHTVASAIVHLHFG